MKRVLLVFALALAACHAARDPSGAVTPEQDRQLNDAAAQLDANAMTNGAMP